MKKKTARPPQQRGLKTRERLLQMTVKCLVEDGVHGLRYANIAKRARVPQALMGYHFPTNQALLLAVVQRELEKLKELSVEKIERYARHPRKALRAYVQGPFELAEVDPEFRAVWTAFYHLASIDPVFANLLSQARRVGRDRIVNLLTMIVATESRPKMPTGVLLQEDLLALATAIQGLITGLGFMAACSADQDFKELRSLADTAASQLYLSKLNLDLSEP